MANPIQRQLFKRRNNARNLKRSACFLFHGCHGDIIDAARNDVIKGRKIAAHVQRKAVHRDPMANTHANGSDLALADPNSGKRFASRSGDAVSSDKLNEQSLEPPQIFVQIVTTPVKIDKRIPHQLPGSMICCLTSTIDREKWMRQMRGAQETGLIRSAPDCVNTLMLQQKQFVQMGRVFSFFRDNLFLQSKSIDEIRPAKPMHMKVNNPCVHICVAPGRPKFATSCERR